MEPYIADLINNPKVPKIIRYLIVSTLEIFLIGVFVMVGVKNDNIAFKAMFFILTVIIVISYIYIIRKINKSSKSVNKKKDRD